MTTSAAAAASSSAATAEAASNSSPQPIVADPKVIEALRVCLFDALPHLPSERMVDLLEFVATQHSGSSFNPDNMHKALEIAAFVQRRPFSVTKPGVASVARLARHALGSKTDDKANTPEHQLWLLTSGALNTAAGICEFGGDAVQFFDKLKHDALVRSKYLQRHYAQMAMQEHVASPDKYVAAAAATDPDAALAREASRGQLSPLHLAFASLVGVVAILGSLLFYSPSYGHNLRYMLGLGGQAIPDDPRARW